ncbi:uncharacterized protein [Cicer arietinum]|uniref:Uncharacterized protein LOC101499430 n=1 Tax=Cicer arietinum TaxID=3827 RepID=A0A1S2YRD8_CICAR|nr:uncharacterized protein LOC101499430 [Cicer arietinum]
MVDDRINHHHHHVTTPVNVNRNELPMVIISDNKDDVFPPINHENLHLFTNHETLKSQSQSQSSPSSSSSPSFSTSDCETWGDYSSFSSPFDSQLRKGGGFIGWLSIGLRILRSKLISTVYYFRNRSSHGGAIWSFGLPAVVITVIVLLRWKKSRTKNLTPNEIHLMKIIMEKDGKIAQLLHQIAQMNEMLVDRHKALTAKVAK